MNTHPKPEEWMSFLYGEDSPSRHSELDAHLRACTECRQQVQTWRGSMAALDSWETPKAARSRVSAPLVRWAAAAVVVLGIGFAFGRITSSTTDDLHAMHAALRSEMETKLTAARAEFAQTLQQQRADLSETIHTIASETANQETRELFTKFAKVLDDERESDREAYLTALKTIEERRATDFAVLRKDLDTVAVNADDGLSRTQEQLMELATLAQPTGN